MPEEQERKILGLPRRTALIVGVALVVVIFLALRARGAVPPPAVVPEGAELAGQGEAIFAAAPATQDAFADRLAMLEIGQAEAEQQFAVGRLRRQERLEERQTALQGGIYDFFLGRQRRLPRGVRCPSGKPRMDPTTGEVYCRQEESRGFFGDLLGGLTGQKTTGGALGSLGREYIAARGGAGAILGRRRKRKRAPATGNLTGTWGGWG